VHGHLLSGLRFYCKGWFALDSWKLSLLCVAFAPLVAASATYVQNATAAPPGLVTNVSLSFDDTQIAGDVNLVFAGWKPPEAELVSVTDSLGNLYLRAGLVSLPGVATQTVYYAAPIKPARARTNSLVLAFNHAVSDLDVRVVEYHGIDATQPLGAVAEGYGIGPTANAQELVATGSRLLAVCGTYAGARALAIGEGYTQRLIDGRGQIVADREMAPADRFAASALLGASSWYLLQAVTLREAPAAAIEPPYPHSRIAAEVSWDFSTVPSGRKAVGSDIWPMTWAADGNLYAAFGDGGGFEGTEHSKATGRTSLGFARISGSPSDVGIDSVIGRNVWGQAPLFAENQATFGGKVDDLLAVAGVLYAQGGLWTAKTCRCQDPTVRQDDNPNERQLAWSRDFGKTWSIVPWSVPSDLGTTLQFGPDYSGATDPAHVYLYYQMDARRDATRIYLRRVRTDELLVDPRTPDHYEYFAGFRSHGAALWSANVNESLPVFQDPTVPPGVSVGPTVIYDAPLARYILFAWHGNLLGQLGIFEAETPWGPWATLDYYDDWGGFNETAGAATGFSLPTKWLSSDGRTFWVVFSGEKNGLVNDFDSLNMLRGTLHSVP
jgi:hypothetical protein